VASAPVHLHFALWLKPLFPPLVEDYAENTVGLFIVQGARQCGVNDLVTAKFSELVKKLMRGSVLNKLA